MTQAGKLPSLLELDTKCKLFLLLITYLNIIISRLVIRWQKIKEVV